MSASLAQLINGLSLRDTANVASSMDIDATPTPNRVAEERQSRIVGHLARQWAYTLGAELAHHVVGVFKDPANSSYRKRWDSAMACSVVPSNPWHSLPRQKYFNPPFDHGDIIARLPPCLKSVPRALTTVSKIVSTRNELQHLPFPEDVYALIKTFKCEKLMKHIASEKELCDFLNSEQFLADWFIGTPRIHRLTGQLLFNARYSLGLPEQLKWADSLMNGDAVEFLENMLFNLSRCDKMEWYKQQWPTTIMELAQDLDAIELTDEGFGPKINREWRKLWSIQNAYDTCKDSGLLTPAIKRFCSLPCALLDNAENIFF